MNTNSDIITTNRLIINNLLKIIPIIFLFSCSPYFLNTHESKQAQYRPLSVDINKHENQPDSSVYSINSNELKKILETSQKEFKVLIFFTWWCPGCNQAIPIILTELEKSENQSVIMITPDDWIYKQAYINYKSKNAYSYKTYMLDVYKYGQKRSPHYRMSKFISEICKDCSEVKGFPSFIVFDAQNNIVLKGTGQEFIKPILEIINHAYVIAP